MNTILDITKVDDMTVLNCDFEPKIGRPVGFRIYSVTGQTFDITDYMYERFTQCFSTAESSPSIITRVDIPEDFLQQGNGIERISSVDVLVENSL